ncbi:hypothetical protein [Ileibacterium valens]|uniref:hypothetical protein n=1 Tax=Ileibacterium valens TaxID=1862668 RepID=UPI002729B368|nr:hypothetical protein [Ileibacterium valens]
MTNNPVTTEQLSKEISRNIHRICKELNQNKDVTIKVKSAGQIKLVCQSQKTIN